MRQGSGEPPETKLVAPNGTVVASTTIQDHGALAMWIRGLRDLVGKQLILIGDELCHYKARSGLKGGEGSAPVD